MANKFAWASISEKKTVNGKAGDQTGNEVKVGNYYNFGQTKCIRIKPLSVRRNVGKIAKWIAKNENVGYGQADRASIFNIAKKSKWNYSVFKKLVKSTKCNTDCSMLAVVCINLAFGFEALPVTTYTGNFINQMRRIMPANSYEVVDIGVAEKKFHKGDMPIRPEHHMIINI